MNKIPFFLSLLVAGAPLTLSAAVIDLSSWKTNGPGTWKLQSGNNAVLQSANSPPTVYHNNINSQGQTFSFQMAVQTTQDDDYIGFVLGYQDGDLESSSADYLLIDWKQNTQNWSGGGTASAGLSISHVTDALPEGPGAWAHSFPKGVEELQRATNLGNVGWNDNTIYSFDVTFTNALAEVFVNDKKELSVSGSFSDGAFGFYNYSQPNVLYSGVEQTPAVVPIPAAFWLFGSGLLGILGWRANVNRPRSWK
ncbi:hypothetical protein ThidrDRAFT_4480 [Thiorhodococcus drewsii AZ1]|uniref:TSP C-terminal domain-containing protein n=1 Tax=Thiorhodococcus drewsii AZ1 TaxID=765913 RepID=G2E866_9GAMM|nr:hypothetical protein [Thiorhodococcus drewsii]EGV27702.1 hypothetical protein ThidrDRAFT_4480 [Thiorhodococcus drewsii AZ1]